MNAALLAKLIEAGTPAELVAEVAMELGRAAATAEVLEQRRKNERERKARSREVTACHVTERDNAEVTDKGSPEVSPLASPLPNPSKQSPLSPPKNLVEMPDWLPASYGEFRAMRKSMRNVPFGPSAERRVIAKLEKLKGEGHDPEKLLSKAIERGHRTVFEDDSTKASAFGKVELTAQQLRERAEWFIRHGQPDRADECRRKAIEKEQIRAVA